MRIAGLGHGYQRAFETAVGKDQHDGSVEPIRGRGHVRIHGRDSRMGEAIEQTSGGKNQQRGDLGDGERGAQVCTHPHTDNVDAGDYQENGRAQQSALERPLRRRPEVAQISTEKIDRCRGGR